MSVVDITDSIKLCSYIEDYELSSKVSGLPRNIVLPVLELDENHGCLKALSELSEEAQLNILGDCGVAVTFREVYDKGYTHEKIDSLFADTACVAELAHYSADDIRAVLYDDSIPVDFQHISLMHPDIPKRKDFARFQAGCRNIKGFSALTEDWCCGHYDLVISGIVVRQSFLSALGDMDEALQIIAENDEVFQILVLLESSGLSQISQEAFEQICDNGSRLLNGLREVTDRIPNGLKRSFVENWIWNASLMHDLSVIKREMDKIGSWDFLRATLDYVAFCQSEVIDFETECYQEPLIAYALQNKKKAFIRLIRQNADAFHKIGDKSVLYCPLFYKECININTLNGTDLLRLAGMTASVHKVERLAHNNLTFKEFEVLYASRAEVIELYYSLDIPSVDEKLNIIREFNNSVTYIGEGNVTKLVKHLKVKKLSDWRNNEFSRIQRINYNTVVKLLIYYDEIQKFVGDIKNREEAERICDNIQIYKDMQSIADIRESLVGTDKDWQWLKSRFQLTDEFVNQNKDNIAEFISKNGAYIAYQYLCAQENCTQDLRKLVVAEVAGRFDEVKYPDDGLAKELGMTVGDEVYGLWQKNTGVQAGIINIWEEDGFIPTMRIGKIPVETCMAYDDGAYRHCLLSNFDTNKKIMFVSKDNEIVLRAIIRLTKGSVTVSNMRNVSFKDITKQESDGNLILFLEKAYCKTLSSAEQFRYFRLMFELLRKKALDMGAVLLCSLRYGDWQDFLMQIEYNLYISASKSGYQYLDSFGSEVSVAGENRYYQTNVFVHKQDV